MRSLLAKLLALRLPRPTGAHASGALLAPAADHGKIFRAPPLGPVNPRRPLAAAAHEPRLHRAP